MPVRHCPNDVLRSPRRIAAEEHAGPCRHERRLVDDGHVPLPELESDVPLDPRECRLLTDRKDDVIARKDHGTERLRMTGIAVPLQPLELHTRELAVLDHEPQGRVVDHDVDAFFLRVLELPRRRLEVLPRPPSHHLDVLATQTTRRPTAIHRGIAHPDDQNALADRRDVIEGHRLQPVDPDVDIGGGLLTTREIQILSTGRTRPDEHCVVTLSEQRLKALNRRVVAEIDAHVDDRSDLFLENLFREPKRRNVDRMTARLIPLLEDGDRIAEWHQVVRDREGCRARSNARDTLAVLGTGCLGKSSRYITLVVGGNTLQSADRDGLAVDSTSPTGWLARTIAGSTEYPRKDVGFSIENVRVVESPLRYETNVLRHVRMRRTRPLAVDDLVEIRGIRGIGRFQSWSFPKCWTQ